MNWRTNRETDWGILISEGKTTEKIQFVGLDNPKNSKTVNNN